MRADFPPSPTRSPSKESVHKPKRPMNAFMLFAKKYRMEYMQLYPGKDNRSVCGKLRTKIAVTVSRTQVVTVRHS